ncbi:MAG TPA: exosome complex protein Rrp42 [Candidatus Nanoarchaeia archaeon]|nr:exosome complex protein Rrp42 [Candidatus Nanoarchaeia archaeon]
MDEEKTPKITAERIKKYLENGKRFDERKLDEFRELTIETGVSKKAEGSVKVKLGKTEVIVGVKMAVGEPYPDSGDKGNLMVTAELLPLSSGRIELGPPKIDSIELGRVIDRGIRESGFLDMEKLCIKENEKVWTLFVDIYSINDDGNLLDAAGIGAYTALKLAKIPKYDEKEDKVLYGEPDKDLPLTDKNPIVTTIYKIGNSLVVDPTREEEDVAEARITIGSSDKSISSIQKGGSEPFTTEEISNALDIAENKWTELFKNLDKQLKKQK